MTDEFLKYLKEEHTKAVKAAAEISRKHPDLDGGWDVAKAKENQLRTLIDRYKEINEHACEVSECSFCKPDDDHYITGTALWYARSDAYPVTKGHTLLIPFSHATDLVHLTREEIEDFPEILIEAMRGIRVEFNPDGFNIGINLGEAAGQTVKHLHVHIIPRYKGDVTDPRGGVRGVIPEKQKYHGAS